MTNFFESVWSVLLELAPWLLLGAASGGLLHVLLPAGFLKRQLAGKLGVLKAVGLGVPLPLCSCGVIPVGMELKKSGASDGATVGFLISTPQTGVDSILVSGSFLGWPFALFKLVSAAVTGIVGGYLTNAFGINHQPAEQTPVHEASRQGSRVAAFFGHSIMLIRSVWGWMTIGILVAAAIQTLVPPDSFASFRGMEGLPAMLITLVIAIPLYVCATASVPIAAALVASGFPTGAALVFLMAGPATNVATLGAVYRTLGGRATVIYLTTVVVGSIACGWLFGFLIEAKGSAGDHHHHPTDAWWSIASAAVLIAMLTWFAWQDVRRFFTRAAAQREVDSSPSIEVPVSGMTCQGCVAKLEGVLTSDPEVSSAIVTLTPGRATVVGDVSETRVHELVEQAGFTIGSKVEA